MSKNKSTLIERNPIERSLNFLNIEEIVPLDYLLGVQDYLLRKDSNNRSQDYLAGRLDTKNQLKLVTSYEKPKTESNSDQYWREAGSGSMFHFDQVTKDYSNQSLKVGLDRNQIDKEFIPYLKELNNLDNVATLWSCWGHPNKGYLVLRFKMDLIDVYQKIFNPLYEITNPLPWTSSIILATYPQTFVKYQLIFKQMRVNSDDKLSLHHITEDEDKHFLLQNFIRLVQKAV